MNFNDPAWAGWEGLKDPQPLKWETTVGAVFIEECYVANRMVAWLQKRPHYCDRGHFSVDSSIPGLDQHDSFPRYYMNYEVSKAETEAWVKWRLWRVRS